MGSKRTVRPSALAWRVMRRIVALGVALGEVIASEVVVVGVVGEHVPEGGQGGVLQGDDGFLFAWSGCQSPVAGGVVGVCGVGGRHRGGA